MVPHFRFFAFAAFHTCEFKVRDEVCCCPLQFLPASRYSFSCREMCRGHVAFLSASNSLHSCISCWADCSASPHGQIGECTRLSYLNIRLVQAVVSCTHSEDHHLLFSSVQLSSVQDGIYALGKPIYMRSTPSLRDFPNVALETVPINVGLIDDDGPFSQSSQGRSLRSFLFLRLSSSPPGDRWL